MSSISASNESVRRRALRMALGVATVFVLAQLFTWPVAHVGAALTVILFMEASPLSLGKGWRVFRNFSVTLLLSVVITTILSPWPAILIVVSGLAFYRLFIYMMMSGAFLFEIAAALLACTVIPVLVIMLPEKGLFMAYGLIVNCGVAIVVSWVVWMMIPLSAPVPEEHHHHAISYEDASSMALTLALLMTILEAFYMISGSGKLLVLIYSVFFVLPFSARAGSEVGLTYIVANVFYGGVAMLICYELFVMTPSIVFMALVMFATVYLFASRIFKGGPTQAFWSSGLFGVLLLLGDLLMKDNAMSTEAMAGRIWQLLLATLYVVFAFSVIEWVKSWRKRTPQSRGQSQVPKS